MSILKFWGQLQPEVIFSFLKTDFKKIQKITLNHHILGSFKPNGLSVIPFWNPHVMHFWIAKVARIFFPSFSQCVLIFLKSTLRKLKMTPGSEFSLKMDTFGCFDWLKVLVITKISGLRQKVCPILWDTLYLNNLDSQLLTHSDIWIGVKDPSQSLILYHV